MHGRHVHNPAASHLLHVAECCRGKGHGGHARKRDGALDGRRMREGMATSQPRRRRREGRGAPVPRHSASYDCMVHWCSTSPQTHLRTHFMTHFKQIIYNQQQQQQQQQQRTQQRAQLPAREASGHAALLGRQVDVPRALTRSVFPHWPL